MLGKDAKAAGNIQGKMERGLLKPERFDHERVQSELDCISNLIGMNSIL